MERVDLTKLEVAIKYIDRIADGCNPVNNTPLSSEDVLNNPNVIRCMYFIKEVLEEVRRNDGIIVGRKKQGTMPFPVEVLDEFVYQDDKSITNVLKQIYAPVQDLNVKKLSAMKITSWLKEEGYLSEEQIPETGMNRKVPTMKGRELGIYMTEREYEGRVYQSVLYDKNAQEYIVGKMREWLEG